MTASSRQLALELPHRTALDREDYFVTPSNESAVALIDSWPDWPGQAILLQGPPGSGKSHLVEVWRQLSGAGKVDASELTSEAVPALLSSGALAIEDLPGTKLEERALFHLLNHTRQVGAHLLLTANSHPDQWSVRLPDLVSRLRALPIVRLGPPDDILLRGVLVKLFADRQLAIEETVISYLSVRMPRSLEAARRLVSEIDERALEEKAEVTRTFVARVLASLNSPALFSEND